MGTRRTRVYQVEAVEKKKRAAPIEEAAGGEKAAEKDSRRKPRPKKAARGKRYLRRQKLIEKDKLYPPEQAISLAKKTAYTKFEAAIEAHFRLGIVPKEQSIRASLILPHGTGKAVKALVFSSKEVGQADLVGDQKTLLKIESGQLSPKRDFDVVVATPEWMPKLAKLAKILGPKGLMPNPKAGTLSRDPEKAVAELKKGRVELKSEANSPLVHTVIGRVSFKEDQLLDNFRAVLTAIKNARPSKVKGAYVEAVVLCATMGPGIKVDVSSL